MCIVKVDTRPALAILLASFAVISQFFNLLRSYPLYQNCGRRVEINSFLSTFINCDSSVFMKDAALPSRLISGESVYQDRILFTFIAIVISQFLSIFFPEQFTEVIGNSGELFSYSSLDYAAFILFNYSILVFSIFLLYKIFQSQLKHSVLGLLSFTTALFFIAFNETTKTYIFTPHSQLFNILLPVWIIFIISKLSDNLTLKKFYIVLTVTLFLSLNYKLFIIAYVLLFFYSRSFRSKMPLYSVIVGTVTTLLLPRIFVEIFNGNFQNYDISHQRVLVWWLDVLRGDSPSAWIFGAFQNFILSIPLIPVSVLLLGVMLSIFVFKIESFHLFKRDLIISFIAFAIFLMALGFSARRLSLALLSIPIIWVLLNLKHSRANWTYLNLILVALILFQFISWAITPGPLV